MAALIELALALAAQFALDRKLAELRVNGQELVVSLAMLAAVLLVGLAGVGFLIVALYARLRESYDAPAAAAIFGGILIAVAATVVIVSMVRARLKAAREKEPPTLPARSLAQREADAVLDEFKRMLASASPLAIAAAVAGLAVGLAGARIGQAVRANGAARR